MTESMVNRLEAVINSLPYGILTINQTGIITTCNVTAANLLALPLCEIIERPFVDIFPSIHEEVKTIFTTKQPMIYKEIMVRGEVFHLSFTPEKSLSAFDEIICILQQTFHSTEQFEKMADPMNVLHLQLENILDSSLDEIFVTDGEGKTLFVNSTGESLYGMNRKQIIGKNVDELERKGLFSPALYPIVKERKEKVSMIQRTKTGKTVHVIANPVFNSDGEITSIIFNSRDITEIKHLKEKIERNEAILKTYKSELEELQNFHEQPADIIAVSPNMRKIMRVINKIAVVDSTILITGESGVGKGVIAKTIHNKSSRKEGPFIHINCGAIPETLIESELFGYDRGAFTGAKKEGKKGVIVQANGGTLFLDEIGEMPLHLQVKLLKVLHDRKIDPIGSSKSIDIDIRIIAATNKNLKMLVENGQFREDLFYRLNVVPIHIPSLRTRQEDVSYMIDYFLKKHNEKYHLSTDLALEAENALIHYHWPGNVRELENIIERLVVTCEESKITIDDLPEYILHKETNNEYIVKVTDICSLKQAQEEMEKQLIRMAYEINKSSYKIADMLEINQSTAIRKIQRYIKGFQ